MPAPQLLIIRSASFQQLDKQLPAIKARFPGYAINLLTHEHGVATARKHPDFDRVLVYPYKESFHARRRMRDLVENFDAVLIPVANLSGAGFQNVLRFSLTLKTRKRVVLNLTSEFRETTQLRIWGESLLMVLFTALSYGGLIVCSLLIIWWLPWKLSQIASLSNRETNL